MLIQLYRDNYVGTPSENLVSTIYSGFFDGFESWFDTATQLNLVSTTDLTSLETITNNLFNSLSIQSVKTSGYFRAKKTGTYRFYTYSNDKNILEVDGDDIIVNNNLNQISFANKSLIAGRYYLFNLYYGSRVFQYPPAPLTGGTTNIQNQTYGNGNYVVTSSSNSSPTTHNRWWAFDYNTSTYWRSGPNYNNDGTYKNTYSTNTIEKGLVYGEWLEIELPSAIVLERFLLRNRTNAVEPKQVKIVASNDDIDWNIIYENDNLDHGNEDTIFYLNTRPTQAFRYYRFIAETKTSTSSATYIEIQEWRLYAKPELECGYLEPNDDGTSSGSTNPADFITNATGLTTYYDINPETISTQTTGVFPLVYNDSSLQGMFKVSPLALYINRGSFSTGKGDILYLASDELFNNFNGTYKNYIQLHERPVAGDITARKKFTEFSSDMSFECELDGKIQVVFRRGTNEPVGWRYAMVILDVERIPTKNI